MNTKLILASMLLMSQTYELSATKSDSKESVKQSNNNKETAVQLLFRKIREKNTPEFSRSICCMKWHANSEVLNLTTELDLEIKRNGISNSDLSSIEYIKSIDFGNKFICRTALPSIVACTTGCYLLLAMNQKDLREANNVFIPLFAISCLTCTANNCGLCETGKSPVLDEIIRECQNKKTCPGKIEMVFSPNNAQKTLPLVEDQNIV